MQVFEGKYGFHNCDKETYRKLKRVRYYNHVNRIQRTAHERWSRKLPKNRVRWKFDGLYSPQMLDISFTKWKAEPWAEPMVCPVNLYLLESEYKNAQPQKTPNDVKPLGVPTKVIDSLIEQAEEWLKAIGKEKR
jgi:hypothetical protein